MISKAQKARLGLFTLIAAVIFAVTLIILTGNKLLDKKDKYYIRYYDSSVSGLEIGSQVKYNGIRVGRIDNVKIDSDDIQAVIVTISVNSGTPIKQNSKAVISSMGITGMKAIEIKDGTNTSANLKPGSFIEPGKSSFDIISGKAEVIMTKTETVLNNLIEITNKENQIKFTSLLEETDNAMKEVKLLLETNRIYFNKTISNSNKISNELIVTAKNLNSLIEQMDILMKSGNIQTASKNLNHITEKLNRIPLDSLAIALNSFLNSSQKTINHIDNTVIKARVDFIRTLATLKETVENMNEFSRLISEDPSILIRGGKKEEIQMK